MKFDNTADNTTQRNQENMKKKYFYMTERFRHKARIKYFDTNIRR